MDSLHVDIIGSGSLRSALNLFFRTSNIFVVGYRVSDNKLVLYQYAGSSRMIPLPFKMDVAKTAHFISWWLEEVRFGKKPPADDELFRKGWRLYTEEWGRVDGEYQALLAVKPVWVI